VNWHENAALLCRRFRAYAPWPGLYAHWRGKRLRLLDVDELPVSNVVAEAMKQDPGVVRSLPEAPGKLVIEAGEGTRLAVRELQLEGRRPQPAAEFLRGYPQILGARLPG
jgi:methionyl-tRNA formyltransferase